MRIDIANSARGIGDSITGMYSACGIAAAGYDVHFYDWHLDWLERCSFPNVTLHPAKEMPDGLADMNARYDLQLRDADCRKQWYCDNVKNHYGLAEDVLPVLPNVNKDVTETFGGNYVVMSPLSHDIFRNLGHVRPKNIARLLGAQGLKVIVIGSIEQLEELTNMFDGVANASLMIAHSPKRISDVMLQSRGYIGLDSGMTHFAGMLGINAVGITKVFPASSLWTYTTVNGYHGRATDEEIVEALL